MKYPPAIYTRGIMRMILMLLIFRNARIHTHVVLHSTLAPLWKFRHSGKQVPCESSFGVREQQNTSYLLLN